MAERLPKILWERAEYLAIRQGWTLEQIAAETGISLAALKKRSSQRQWVQRRRAQMNVREKLHLLAEKQLDQMISQGSTPSGTDGVQKLIKAARDLSQVEDPGEAMPLPELWRRVLPIVREMDPAAAAVLARHEAEILQRLTVREDGGRAAAAQAEPRKGLSPEMAEEIRKKVLGES